MPAIKLGITEWGPAFWHTLHAVSFNFPPNATDAQQKEYAQFFQAIKNVLPCPICKTHYAENLAQFAVPVTSTRALSEWVVNLHNRVNARDGKREYTYLEVAAQYLFPSMYDNVVSSPAELLQLRKYRRDQQRDGHREDEHGNKSCLPKVMLGIGCGVVCLVLLVLLMLNISKCKK